MSAPSLPTPRQLLTNLINTLSSHSPQPADGSNNPLQNATPEIRSLLTTLHIIFPHLLLPALDLLDRQLVTKIWQRPSQPPNTTLHDTTEASKDAVNSFYHVQSSQSTTRRHQKTYIVRLSAWNCTCASFTFSAFPPSSSSATTPTPTILLGKVYPLLNQPARAEGVSEAGGEGQEEKWEFGALSRDGLDGGAVPACKHLLAACLADRWSVLGEMVKERWVVREEMAGLSAGF